MNLPIHGYVLRKRPLIHVPESNIAYTTSSYFLLTSCLGHSQDTNIPRFTRKSHLEYIPIYAVTT